MKEIEEEFVKEDSSLEGNEVNHIAFNLVDEVCSGEVTKNKEHSKQYRNNEK